MPAPAPPVGAVERAELDPLFAPVGDAGAIGLAVSGGPDSTALLLLAERWAAGRDPRPSLHVLTVDHALRPGSRAEAEAVLALARNLGLPATLLTWSHDGEPPVADVQSAARAARYRLLAHAARRLRLDVVLLGHTRDDQAETFLIRLARGSGVRGLAGMPAERSVHGVRFLRPLLGVAKERLVATCAERGVAFAEDPSNASDRFLRSRLRRLAPDLAAVGLDAARLADTARRLARAAAAIDAAVSQLAAGAVVDHGGVLSVDPVRLAAAPEEVALRLVAEAIRDVRPAAYLPRAAPLEDWLAAFRRSPGELRRRTVAGVVLDLRRDRLWLYAEAGRRGFPVVPVAGPGEVVWDGRFRVVLAGDVPDGLAIAAATGDGRRADLPKAAAASLPVVVGTGPDGSLGTRFTVAFERLRPGEDAIDGLG